MELRPRHSGVLEPINRADGLALFDPASGAIHELDPTSMAIWEACDGETTVSEIADALRELGGVDRDTAQQLVQSSLSQLAEAGLISL